MSTKIALVPMAAKPYHIGHDSLIQIASQENSIVNLYVSTSSRENISGAQMMLIWKQDIEPILPKNVLVYYTPQPVLSVYNELKHADQELVSEIFTIYSDDKDMIANFPDKRLQKNSPTIFAMNQIQKRSISRSSTVDISGTKMRDLIMQGDKETFMKYLPNNIDKEHVWLVLTSSE